MGAAQADEHQRMAPEELLTRADATMYTAKRLRNKLASSAPPPLSGELR